LSINSKNILSNPTLLGLDIAFRFNDQIDVTGGVMSFFDYEKAINYSFSGTYCINSKIEVRGTLNNFKKVYYFNIGLKLNY